MTRARSTSAGLAFVSLGVFPFADFARSAAGASKRRTCAARAAPAHRGSELAPRGGRGGGCFVAAPHHAEHHAAQAEHQEIERLEHEIVGRDPRRAAVFLVTHE